MSNRIGTERRMNCRTTSRKRMKDHAVIFVLMMIGLSHAFHNSHVVRHKEWTARQLHVSHSQLSFTEMLRGNCAVGKCTWSIMFWDKKAQLQCSGTMPISSTALRATKKGMDGPTIVFTQHLEILAKEGRALEADELLQQAVHRSMQSPHDTSIPHPNTVSFTTVIDAYSRVNDYAGDGTGVLVKDAPYRAEALLRQMQALCSNKATSNVVNKQGSNDDRKNSIYSGNQNGYMAPNTFTYSSAINCWAKSTEYHTDAARRAEALLYEMQEQYENGNENVKPNSITFTTVIDALAKSNEVEVDNNDSNQNNGYRLGPAERAENILRLMVRLYEEGNPDVRPNTISFTCVIDALAKRGLADRAESVLRWMLEVSKAEEHREGATDRGKMHDVRPNAYSFTTVIGAYAKSGWDDAGERAEALLRQMMELNEGGNHPDVQPTTSILSAVVDAYAKSTRRDAAERADAILQQMISWSMDVDNDGGLLVRPSVYTFTSAIDAYARSGRPDAPERAEGLLKQMLSLSQLAKSDEKIGDSWDAVRPNTVTFTAVINAYAKQGLKRKGAAEKAEAILHTMIRMEKAGYKNVGPTTVTFSAVINAFAKSGRIDAGEKAESILRWMIEYGQTRAKSGDDSCLPNTITFNAVLNAYAKSGNNRASERAESVVEEMTSLYNSGQLKTRPNRVTFTSVIDALAKSSRPDRGKRAEVLLRRMVEMYEDGNPDAMPDTIAFTAVLKTLARSDEPHKSQRAHAILCQMEEMYQAGNAKVKPDVMSYNSVLNACTFVDQEEQREGLRVLFKTMTALYQSKEYNTNSISYSTFIKGCGRLMDRSVDRDAVVEKAFSRCRDTGLVDKYVIESLRLASPRIYNVVINEIRDLQIDEDAIPEEWGRKVAKKERFFSTTEAYRRGRSQETRQRRSIKS